MVPIHAPLFLALNYRKNFPTHFIFMKFILLVVAFIAACVTASSVLDSQFAEFKAKFNKAYTSRFHEMQAKAVFAANLARLEEARQRNPVATFGITQFMDLTPEAFRSKIGNTRTPKAATRVTVPRNGAAPSILNWVTRGAVTPVQNQGECGSDWAFAAVANIEGVNFVKNGQLTALSVEEIIDCDTLDNGCNGGFMQTAFEWLLQKQGGNIMTAATWPYTAGASNCSYVFKTVGATVTSYENIEASEDAMTTYTATYGPIASAVDADSWQFYESGVLTNCSATTIDAGITVVGYNDVANPPYWIIKNTWGATWGMNGYIYIKKGVNACGIKEYPISAVVAGY